MIVAIVLGLGVAACTGGDDGERKRAEAAEWCHVTARVDSRPDWDVIDFDLAAEWMESAPDDIRSATQHAARIRRELTKDPKPAALVEAEREITAYKKDNCPDEGQTQ